MSSDESNKKKDTTTDASNVDAVKTDESNEKKSSDTNTNKKNARGGSSSRKYRKRGNFEDEMPPDDATGDGQTEDNRPIKELIEETRELQKMRQRYKGVDLTVTESSAAEAWLAARESSNDATVASLGETFTAQSVSNPIDQQLEKYIQERMKKADQGVEEPKKKKQTEEDLLYEVPDNLKANREVKERQPASTLMTGIVEVELPIEYKLKNIEATEAAKRQLEDAIKSGAVSEQSLNQQGGSGASGGETNSGHHNRGGRGNQATDDMVLERFKKRFRY